MNRLLIVRLGAMGDIVHTIPFAAALREAMPHARIDWLVDARHEALLELVPAVSRRVLIAPRSLGRARGRRQLVDTLRELRRARYDVAFDLQGLLKSAVLARMAGAGQTIGFTRPHLREPAARLFYTRMHDPGGATHVIDKNLALLGAIGLDEARVRFPLAVPASPAAEAIVARASSGPDRRLLVMNPGAGWPNKQWPAARFGAVAAALRESRGLRTVVLWGPGEEALAREVVEAASGAAELAPPTTVHDLVAIAKASALFIAGDTGPLQVAVAVGAPIVALFGPTRPERNGPIAAGDIVLSRAGDCRCLYERRCRLASPCLLDIPVQAVVEAAERRLDAAGLRA